MDSTIGDFEMIPFPYQHHNHHRNHHHHPHHDQYHDQHHDHHKYHHNDNHHDKTGLVFYKFAENWSILKVGFYPQNE